MSEQLAVGILGSTGSIGTQALQVIAGNSNKFRVELLACNTNSKLLEAQIAQFKPNIAVCSTINNDEGVFSSTKVFNDLSILNYEETYKNCDIVINGISGIGGLLPSLAVLKSAANLATANKESIVCGGHFLNAAAKQNNKIIIPLDSEHSALFQCIELNNTKKLILTASGGAFRDKTRQQLAAATAQEALIHPNWTMGKKVTIDSATLVNKALEVVEASYLFGISNIDVVIHKESIVHALVEFFDGSYKASLSMPDMRLPIQYALCYPQRIASQAPSLDIAAVGSLTFAKPDYIRFPCLSFGYEVLKNPTLGVALCASDEVAVNKYLAGEISFYGIYELISSVLLRFKNEIPATINDILSMDKEVREYTLSLGSLGGSK